MRSAHISHDRGAICPFTPTSPAASMALRAEFRAAAGLRLTPLLRCFQGRAMESDTRTGLGTVQEKAPDWWPYTPEFPHWRVWRGVAGLLYARRPRSTPPRVVRGRDTGDLRDRIRQADALL
jgi:hypothetical protein